MSWDEALDEIVARLKPLAAADPERSCRATTPARWAWCSTVDGPALLPQARCLAARPHAVLERRQGGAQGDARRLGRHGSRALRRERASSSCGARTVVSNLHLWSRVQAAKRRGAKIVAIDPYRSLSAEKCTQHIAPLPGTDGALALGMMHVLISAGLIDRDHLELHLGFAALKARVLDQYTPAWAASICGISVDEVNLAREYGTLSRRRSGSTTACSATPAAASRRAPSPACPRSPARGAMPRAASCSHRRFLRLRPRGARASRSPRRPAARDQPLQAWRRANGRATAGAHDDRVQQQPVAVCPDSEKVIAGFSREDLFTVVMDHFQTDTADYADILLPATTQLEHYDVHSPRPPYMVANNPAIAPVGSRCPTRRCSAPCGAHGVRRALPAIPMKTLPNGAQWRIVGQPETGRGSAAAALRAVRAGRLPHALGQVRVLQRVAGEAGHRPAALL